MNKKCQVFTPEIIVNELLDSVEYTCNLFGKKVIENACGDGNIILAIVRRYIEDSIKNKIKLDDIKEGLQRDIYGAEIDEIHYKKCIDNLNELVQSYNISGVKWNIMNDDFLKCGSETKFDFIIGNPPYIKYRDLDFETRGFLKENFSSCKVGKFDYCYAFIEASINILNENGKLAYLIPNSIFKNVFAENLRCILKKNLLCIIDYTTQKLFQNALTSSAILIYQQNSNSEYIIYQDKTTSTEIKLNKSRLKEKWIFSEEISDQNEKRRFGDYFHASISTATLLNKAFILGDVKKDGNLYINDNIKIEADVIREAASPRGLNYSKKEHIVFPYYYENEILCRYSEEEFNNKFPNATKYLSNFKLDLLNRKSDKKTKWFEYGRSQALAHLNQQKLLLSTIITKKVNVYLLDHNTIPYAGIYVVKKNVLPLEDAISILKSKEFFEYISSIGINASGNSIRITANDINQYYF